MSRNRFCKYMKFNRINLYYKPKGESGLNLRIMEIIEGHSQTSVDEFLRFSRKCGIAGT